MWSFATHAGAGMAIAGITATYYALSRRNNQGEHERMEHETGFGDGPQVNRLRRQAQHGQLSSSHMLLKKELAELSNSLNGSGSGLNILYQHKYPLHQFYHRSQTGLSPGISRVETRPSTIYSQENEESELKISTSLTSEGDGKSVFGSGPSLATTDDSVENAQKGEEFNKKSNNQLPNLSTLSPDEAPVPLTENKSSVVTQESGDKAEDTSVEEDSDNMEKVGRAESIPVNLKESLSVNEKWKSNQDNQRILKRTTSPICFFKNPGFGNKSVVRRRKVEPGLLVAAATLSSSNINDAKDVPQEKVECSPEAYKTRPYSTSDDSACQNSTQFLLSPALSQSNVSVLAEENPESKLLHRKKPAAVTSTVVDTNPVVEMSEYNKNLEKNVHITRSKDDSKLDTSPQLARFEAETEINEDLRSSHPLSSKPCAKPVILPPSHAKLSTIDACVNTSCNQQIQKEKSPSEKNSTTEVSTMTSTTTTNNFPNYGYPAEKLDPAAGGELGGVFEKPLLMPGVLPKCKVGTVSEQTSQAIEAIPAESWISLPVRLYTNYRMTSTLPWSLIGVCCMVVIIAGFFGLLLTKLANSVSRKHDSL